MNKVFSHKKNSIFKNINSDVDFHWFNGSSSLHQHDYYEIFLITHGTVSHTYLDKTQTIFEKEFVLVFPQKTHIINATQYMQHFNISISSNFIKKICDIISPNFFNSFTPNTTIYKGSLSDEEYTSFISQINNITNNSEETNIVNEATIKNYIMFFLIKIYSIYFVQNIESTTYPKWFKEFINKLSLPTYFCLPIKELYHISGYSQSVIINYFKKYTGQTLIEYVTKLKINYAKILLSKTNKSILEISNTLNFSSLSHFITTFKKHAGTTPYAYRIENFK